MKKEYLTNLILNYLKEEELSLKVGFWIFGYCLSFRAVRREIRKLVDKIVKELKYEEKVKYPLYNYGKYTGGLTKEDIKYYLFNRNNEEKIFANISLDLEILYNKFCEIAGVNTGIIVDGHCLMFRHDVLRFADQLFRGKKTYFD